LWIAKLLKDEFEVAEWEFEVSQFQGGAQNGRGDGIKVNVDSKVSFDMTPLLPSLMYSMYIKYYIYRSTTTDSVEEFAELGAVLIPSGSIETHLKKHLQLNQRK
jgi:hypothetical protein